MRWGEYNKVPIELLEDLTSMEYFIKQIIHHAKIRVIKKSLRLLNPKIRIGYDGDDFVQNLKTIIIEFDAYKMPRIVKRIIKL